MVSVLVCSAFGGLGKAGGAGDSALGLGQRDVVASIAAKGTADASDAEADFTLIGDIEVDQTLSRDARVHITLGIDSRFAAVSGDVHGCFCWVLVLVSLKEARDCG